MEFSTFGNMEGDVGVDDLIQTVVDVRYNEAQLSRLEGLLETDDTVRDLFMEYCQIECDLHHFLGEGVPRNPEAYRTRSEAAEERGDAVCPDG